MCFEARYAVGSARGCSKRSNERVWRKSQQRTVSSEGSCCTHHVVLVLGIRTPDRTRIKETMLATIKSGRPYAWALLLFQSILIIIFFVGTDYSEKPEDPRIPSTHGSNGAISESSVTAYYWFFIHIALMMPIGFGYLVTFLRKYRYSGVGFTFLLTAVLFQWSLIVVKFWEKVRKSVLVPKGAGLPNSPLFRLCAHYRSLISLFYPY